jgi:hypothetical protein
MARVKMKDTTAHADTGQLVAGEVYEVSDDLAAHLIDIGLAAKTTAQTSADRAAELNAPEPNPSIEEQAAAAGTKPGDQSTESAIRMPQPLNRPATAAEQTAATQSAIGSPPAEPKSR